METIKGIFNLINGEFLLDIHPNGGGIIILRAFWCSSFLFGISLAFYELIDPAKSACFSFLELRKLIHDKFEWYGAIFVAIYIALYTRFSSQSAYLMQLYNQIMQSRAELPDKNPNAAPAVAKWAQRISLSRQDEHYVIWMAGFIADAFLMHLARKEIFSVCIKSMLDIKGVKEAYEDGSSQNRDEIRKFILWYEKTH